MNETTETVARMTIIDSMWNHRKEYGTFIAIVAAENDRRREYNEDKEKKDQLKLYTPNVTRKLSQFIYIQSRTQGFSLILGYALKNENAPKRNGGWWRTGHLTFTESDPLNPSTDNYCTATIAVKADESFLVKLQSLFEEVFLFFISWFIVILKTYHVVRDAV